MTRVKYRCERCGYSEKLTFRNYLTLFFRELFIMLGMIVGIIFLVYSLLSNENLGINFVNSAMSSSFTDFAKQHDDELRDVALNLTSSCQDAHSLCYTEKLYYSLKDLKYIPSSKYKILYDPIYVLDNGGDCRNTAALFVGLMNSLGFDAEVVCSLEENHCVSKIPLKKSYDDEYEEYAVVDLALGYFKILYSTQDVWEYDD